LPEIGRGLSERNPTEEGWEKGKRCLRIRAAMQSPPKRPSSLKTVVRHFETETLPSILEILAKQVEALDVEVEVLQSAQALIPLPSRTQVARMRRGTLPLTRHAYLLGRLQRAIVMIENVASDLRTGLEHAFGNLESVELVEADFNAIEAAVARLTL
jgi:hypothetical protein